MRHLIRPLLQDPGPRSLAVRQNARLFSLLLVLSGGRGDVVVKALRYKLAGRGLDSRWCHWNFLVT
jgi:hypothetical protein